MIDRTKTYKRLGIVGAAAAVGLVPLSVLATPAFAVTPGSASLTISPATTSTATTTTYATATDSFTTNSALPSGGKISIGSLASSGTAEALPAESSVSLANTSTSTTPNYYTVTFTPSGGTATTATGTVTSTAAAATITITNATGIPSGAAVTVTVGHVGNPATPSTVYFSDDTSSDTTPAVNTNTVSIGTAVVSAPSVKSVNPTAYYRSGGEPFTIVGTNIAPGTGTGGINPGAPVVCFVASGTTAPTPVPPVVSGGTVTTAASVCPGAVSSTGVATSAPAGVTFSSAGEIQGTSPDLLTVGGGTSTAASSYNVVVYNYDPSANSGNGGYTAGSATSGTTLVGVSSGLNVIPEAGVRVVDSRTGQALPKGALTTGTPIAIPLSNFVSTPQVPTNIPGNTTASTLAVSGVDVNVTAVAPSAPGNIQMWTGTSCTTNPGTATVNFQSPQDTNNSQLVPVAANTATTLCVQDNGAAVNLVIDATGYTTAASGYTLTQNRVLDTRPASQKGSLLGPLQSGTVYRVNTGITCTVGTNCATNNGMTGTMVALNVADVAPSAPGNLRVFPEPASGAPAPSAVPNTAVDNYIVNTDGSAQIVTMVPPSGYIDLYSDMGTVKGTVNVVIDELGAFSNTATPSLHPVAEPFRIYDSRPGPIPAAGTVTVQGAPAGAGSNFVPTGALGLVGNLSDINPAGQGYLATYPAGGALPGTASIANFPMQTRNTNNMVALNPTNGSFSIYSGGAATNTTYDVSGFIS